MAPRVLISDALSAAAVQIFKDRGVEVDFQPALGKDKDKLAHPGDLLHEAGHLAVTEPDSRNAPSLAPTDAEEMATLAWSWAALKALDLDPAVVFHPHGYKGGGQSLIDAFAGGGGPGTPMLQWFGMTVTGKAAAEQGVAPFPHMLRWLR